MSYTFRVVFDGVCAYVPDRPFFSVKSVAAPLRSVAVNRDDITSGSVKSFVVLLPDLRRPGKPRVPRSALRFPDFRDPHFPLLTFRLGDLREGSTRRVDLVARDISRSDEDGILFLRREQIRFHLNSENSSAFSFANSIPCDPYGLPDLGSKDELESIWWLPDLSQIVEGNDRATTVRPEFLPSYKGPFPDGLIARVECEGGRLRTYDFNRNIDGAPLAWRFAKPDAESHCNGTWNRALSNSVALEFFDVRDEVHIELKRLANEVETEEIVLAPGPGASKQVLEIHISNREPDLLFQEEGFSRSALPDMDFQAFYELLSLAKLNEVPALPIPNPARQSFFGIREKPCAGGLMTVGGN